LKAAKPVFQLRSGYGNLFLRRVSSDAPTLVQLIMKGYPKLLDFKSTCRYAFRCPPWLDGRRCLWHEAANHPYAWCCRLRSRRLWNAGNGRPPSLRGWCAEGKLSSYWPLGPPTPMWDAPWGSSGRVVRTWAKRFLAQRLDGLSDAPGRGAKGDFSPGGRDPRGTPRLRTSGFAGLQPLPMGWHRTGAPTHR
jgi:hypothetical protein